MEKSWMPSVAGIVCIVCGCLALMGLLLLAGFGLVLFAVPELEVDEFPLMFIQAALGIGALGCLVLGWTAIFGGISALQRRRWGWCLAGAIASTLICPPLGVAAIILMVLSEQELK